MTTTGADERLARRLVLDELFDLSLYRALREVAPPSLHAVFDALIPVETRHAAFWQDFFGLKHVTTLDLGRRIKLALIIAVCRVFGAPAIHLVLEAIEVHGIKKYLDSGSATARGRSAAPCARSSRTSSSTKTSW